VLQITDWPFLSAAVIVTQRRSIGFKVTLKAMDWSTNLSCVRTRTYPRARERIAANDATVWQANRITHPRIATSGYPDRSVDAIAVPQLSQDA